MNPAQLRVCNVLIHWIQSYPEDFDVKMKTMLDDFIENISRLPLFNGIVKKLLACKKKYLDSKTSKGSSVPLLKSVNSLNSTNSHRNGNGKNSLKKSNKLSLLSLKQGQSESIDTGYSWTNFFTRGKSSLSLLHLDDHVLALQLCCLDEKIYKKIKPRDLLEYTKNKTNSVGKHIDFFNYISCWVMTSVLKESKSRIRGKLIEKFMRIAQLLYELHNYNTLMAVVAGLSSAPLRRLNVKSLQDKSCFKNFEKLELLMNSEKSYASYRRALKESQPPCIPYL